MVFIRLKARQNDVCEILVFVSFMNLARSASLRICRVRVETLWVIRLGPPVLFLALGYRLGLGLDSNQALVKVRIIPLYSHANDICDLLSNNTLLLIR